MSRRSVRLDLNHDRVSAWRDAIVRVSAADIEREVADIEREVTARVAAARPGASLRPNALDQRLAALERAFETLVETLEERMVEVHERLERLERPVEVPPSAWMRAEQHRNPYAHAPNLGTRRARRGAGDEP